MKKHIIMTEADCNCDKNDEPNICYVCDAGLDICLHCGKAESQLKEPCIAVGSIVVDKRYIQSGRHHEIMSIRDDGIVTTYGILLKWKQFHLPPKD